MKKTLIPILLALSLFLTACNGVAVREATPTPFPTPVRETFSVARGDILVETPLYGRVSQRILAAVSFEISGKVSTVYAQAGDLVEAGQLLAELEELKGLSEQASETRDEIRRAQIALEIEQLALDNQPDWKKHQSHSPPQTSRTILESDGRVLVCGSPTSEHRRNKIGRAHV